MFSCKRERSRKVNTYSSDQQDYLEIVQYTPAKTENTLHYGGTTNRPCRVDICSETLYVENFAQQSALNRYARCSIEVKAEAMSSFNPEGGPNTAFDHMMEAEQRSHREHVLSNEISHCGQQQGGLLYLTRTLLVQSEAVQRWQRPGRIPVSDRNDDNVLTRKTCLFNYSHAFTILRKTEQDSREWLADVLRCLQQDAQNLTG
ncbi:hypothetical protein T4B_5558 [Trichinella pseudospiralis]|uniref:Uncharacterized protein n=1 Tax=Trichinella pseudospiralis TaxID=6337 RepID=A0A0V1IH47_TRIPS|nr:hypothetical protein T4A_7309 [Trichinella pseudospiralis]KRZ21876.1 hypothetical protein T4B_5558 [Trichinella pseudospiralis]